MKRLEDMLDSDLLKVMDDLKESAVRYITKNGLLGAEDEAILLQDSYPNLTKEDATKLLVVIAYSLWKGK